MWLMGGHGGRLGLWREVRAQGSGQCLPVSKRGLDATPSRASDFSPFGGSGRAHTSLIWGSFLSPIDSGPDCLGTVSTCCIQGLPLAPNFPLPQCPGPQFPQPQNESTPPLPNPPFPMPLVLPELRALGLPQSWGWGLGEREASFPMALPREGAGGWVVMPLMGHIITVSSQNQMRGRAQSEAGALRWRLPLPRKILKLFPP